MPHLTSNDIILDCGNEHYANTERRQAKCKDIGIHYLGVGVSGGHQAAGAGPSMCPGGDKEALSTVMPLLEQVAAKDKEGKPCVGMVGRGGAGHYVKMVHNGIEHGMMSAISEAWGIMRAMGMEYKEIGDVFGKWNESGELVCVPNLRFSPFHFPSSLYAQLQEIAVDTSTSILTTQAARHIPHLHQRRPLPQTRLLQQPGPSHRRRHSSPRRHGRRRHRHLVQHRSH